MACEVLHSWLGKSWNSITQQTFLSQKTEESQLCLSKASSTLLRPSRFESKAGQVFFIVCLHQCRALTMVVSVDS
jgi:hypothetical protein